MEHECMQVQELKSTIGQKNTKPSVAGNPFTGTLNPNVWKKKENSDLQ
jgi:hypothetical protein